MSNSRNNPNQLPQKCPWIMRVGVFFDGTGNNKENDKKEGKMSNIAKLSDSYQVIPEEGSLKELKMVYKNGVGTVDGDDD